MDKLSPVASFLEIAELLIVVCAVVLSTTLALFKSSYNSIQRCPSRESSTSQTLPG